MLQRQLFARSERVKGIDFHPTEPWVSFLNSLSQQLILINSLDLDNLVQWYVHRGAVWERSNALITPVQVMSTSGLTNHR